VTQKFRILYIHQRDDTETAQSVHGMVFNSYPTAIWNYSKVRPQIICQRLMIGMEAIRRTWYSRDNHGYTQDAILRRVDTVICHTLHDGVVNERIEKLNGDVYCRVNQSRESVWLSTRFEI